MNKKSTGLLLSILGVISLVLITAGVTYAFFSYTKEGLTENVIAQINDNLYAHELIKIKAQRNIPEPITKMARDICDACKCMLIGVIGNKIIVYKPTEKPKFAHLLDNYKYFY